MCNNVLNATFACRCHHENVEAFKRMRYHIIQSRYVCQWFILFSYSFVTFTLPWLLAIKKIPGACQARDRDLHYERFYWYWVTWLPGRSLICEAYLQEAIVTIGRVHCLPLWTGAHHKGWQVKNVCKCQISVFV